MNDTQRLIIAFCHLPRGKGHLIAKIVPRYTKGFVRHFLMGILQSLDFVGILRGETNQSSTELMFYRLHVKPVI